MASTPDPRTADAARTIAALWGTRPAPRRGPRHALTTAQVVTAAVAIADAEQDVAALSMRRVADRLGVGTMSLYTYVASRDELLELMADAVAAEAVAALRNRPGAETWPDGLRRLAGVAWDLALRHPWTLQTATGRPPLGPHTIARYELELGVVEGVGLGDVEMDAVVTLVHDHVAGVARRRVEADRVQRRTGLTDAQWWDVVGPPLAEVLDADAYPVAARVGTAAGEAHQAAHSPEHAYTFGLERLIAGVAALVGDRDGVTRR